MHINIRVYLLEKTEHEALALQWQALEKNSDASFFLSWLWIEAWLALVSEPVFVIEATEGEQTVGLSIWCERTRKVLGLFPIKQAWLHKTGDIPKDQMWIEYNDFLLARGNEKTIRTAMLNFIKESELDWQELVFGLSDTVTLEYVKQVLPDYHESIVSLGYQVDFTQLTQAYRNDVLSKNTRSQINRSYKLLSERGDVSFKVLKKRDDIEQCLPSIAQLHIERWRNIEDGSGFDNPYFVNFHHQVLKHSHEYIVEVCVLSLNNEPLGYLYNYTYKGTVYFYLSALTANFPAKIKIGMLLHTLAIEHYAEQGIKKYDFLAGDAQYKRSLANKSYRMAMWSFAINSRLLWGERLLKAIKHKVVSLFRL